MSTVPAWQYDEFKQIGTDYDSIAEVEAYDRRMQSLRNVAQEAEHILGVLDVTPQSTILEIGTGTGEFAVRAAARCARVFAVDISQMMLEYSRRKAEMLGVHNIEFKRAGFLTFECGSVDAVASQLALHHLPDYWKAVALSRVFDALKDGGRLFLNDVVFSGDIDSHEALFSKWTAGAERAAGNEIAREIAAHIRDEYSTLDWVMEGLLKTAGLSIISADYSKELFTSYVCAK
jgi:putative AdoMet-dependent methyltransferase